jgi:hypothetical protein
MPRVRTLEPRGMTSKQRFQHPVSPHSMVIMKRWGWGVTPHEWARKGWNGLSLSLYSNSIQELAHPLQAYHSEYWRRAIQMSTFRSYITSKQSKLNHRPLKADPYMSSHVAHLLTEEREKRNYEMRRLITRL